MKTVIYLLVFLFINQFAFGQTSTNQTTFISSEILQKIKYDVEKSIPAYRNELVAKNMNANQIEFSIDTFRIEQIVSKRMDINTTTSGMNVTVLEATKSYDSLMNKYYNKLLKRLKQEDKKILIEAQKAWLTYRDAERKLIGVVNKDAYTGGGTIYRNIAVGTYAELVESRTIMIFNYYESILNLY